MVHVLEKRRFPSEILSCPLVVENFNKALDMINTALDLGPANLHLLPPPEAGPVRPLRSVEKKEKAKAKVTIEAKRDKVLSGIQNNPEQAFREAMEDWCAEHSLLLLPLRRADERSGRPLFRITDSAAGTGDVVWVKRKERVGKEKGDNDDGFQPAGLEGLLKMMEGGGR